MIYIGLGGNLPWQDHAPESTLRRALSQLTEYGMGVVCVSPFYRSAPVPVSAQPWFVNAIAQIQTDLPPQKILSALLSIEEKFGRQRTKKNDARTLDLDLLDYKNKIINHENLVLPHPRMDVRAFVLQPLSDIAPDWRHPVNGKNAAELLSLLGDVQGLEKISD